ncbi:hypothetical protein HZS_6278, partial [Henneguya salminicola]
SNLKLESELESIEEINKTTYEKEVEVLEKYEDFKSQISNLNTKWDEIKTASTKKNEKIFGLKRALTSHLAKINKVKQKITQINELITTCESTISTKMKLLNKQGLVETDDTQETIRFEISQLEKSANTIRLDPSEIEILKKKQTSASKTYNEQLNYITNSIKLNDKLKEMLDIRQEDFEKLRRLVVRRTENKFRELLQNRGYSGSILFDHESKKLTINVSAIGADVNCKDSKGLSGGERSFSTLAFIISLWQSIDSPFRCLDEFDVFMDLVNRTTGLKLLKDFSISQPYQQLILITPQNVSELNSEGVTILKMDNPR